MGPPFRWLFHDIPLFPLKLNLFLVILKRYFLSFKLYSLSLSSLDFSCSYAWFFWIEKVQYSSLLVFFKSCLSSCGIHHVVSTGSFNIFIHSVFFELAVIGFLFKVYSTFPTALFLLKSTGWRLGSESPIGNTSIKRQTSIYIFPIVASCGTHPHVRLMKRAAQPGKIRESKNISIPKSEGHLNNHHLQVSQKIFFVFCICASSNVMVVLPW